MTLSLLPSDYIIYSLFYICIACGFYIRTQPHLREPWKKVFLNKGAVICGVILSVYIIIGLLDSLHFSIEKNNVVQQKSLLDLMISPLGTQDEKTYSAPFATHLYQMEGGQYPLLKYPGTHFLGTNKIGQDMFYETIKSVRTGLLIGTLTTVFMLPFALFFGMIAGYFGGFIDDVIQYLYTTLSSIPGVLLITAMVLVMQVIITNHPALFPTIADRADARLLTLCFILGITSWASLCRLLRAETLKLREQEFITASIAMGSRKFPIIMRHILPNVMHIIIITTVLDFSGLVLAEAILSYVGVGVDPTTASWGNMINTSRLELAREPMVWWPLFSALSTLFFLVLSANLFADSVRDAFDPRV
ncbi:MAG: ABC transporter permease [Gammaproteobacteria bacterium]|nr:ABC transporter permease [Gammaproteobacteria bacterium]